MDGLIIRQTDRQTHKLKKRNCWTDRHKCRKTDMNTLLTDRQTQRLMNRQDRQDRQACGKTDLTTGRKSTNQDDAWALCLARPGGGGVAAPLKLRSRAWRQGPGADRKDDPRGATRGPANRLCLFQRECQQPPAIYPLTSLVFRVAMATQANIRDHDLATSPGPPPLVCKRNSAILHLEAGRGRPL